MSSHPRRPSFPSGVLLPSITPLLIIAVLRLAGLDVDGWIGAALLLTAVLLYLSRLNLYWGPPDDISSEAVRFGRLIWILLLLIPLNFFYIVAVAFDPFGFSSAGLSLVIGALTLFILETLFLQLVRLSPGIRWKSLPVMLAVVVFALMVFSDWSGQIQFMLCFLFGVWIFKFEACRDLSRRRKTILVLSSLLGILLLAVSVNETGARNLSSQRLVVGDFITIQVPDALRFLRAAWFPLLTDMVALFRRLLFALLIILPGRIILRPFAQWLRVALKVRTKLALSYLFSSVIPALLLLVLLLLGMLFMMGGFWQLLLNDMIEARTETLKTLWESGAAVAAGDFTASPGGTNEILPRYWRDNRLTVVFADLRGSGKPPAPSVAGAPLPDLAVRDSGFVSFPESLLGAADDSAAANRVIRVRSGRLTGKLGAENLIRELGENSFRGWAWFGNKPYLTVWLAQNDRLAALFMPFTQECLQTLKEHSGVDLMIISGSQLRDFGKGKGNLNFTVPSDFKPAMRTAASRPTRGALDFPLYFPTLFSSLAWDPETGFEKTSSIILVQTSLFSLFEVVFSPEHLVNRLYLILLTGIAAFFGFILVLVGLFGFGLVRGITRSVANLRRGTQQLRKGDLDAVIQVQSRDELGELAASFNLMVADIKRMLEEVKEKERLEGELDAAKAIQRKLLPETIPDVPGYDIAATSLPAKRVGGDYYDILPFPGNRWGIAVADVSGKGMPAALLMANLQASLRTLAQSNRALDEMVRELNIALYRNTAAHMFATFFIAVLDAENGSIKYVNAGHNPPIRCADGETALLRDGGMLLGVMPEAEYRSARIEVTEGEVLAIYSDGITEAEDAQGNQYGENRLTRLLKEHCRREAGEILQAVLRDVQDVCGNPQDDVTLVIVKRVSS